MLGDLARVARIRNDLVYPFHSWLRVCLNRIKAGYSSALLFWPQFSNKMATSKTNLARCGPN